MLPRLLLATGISAIALFVCGFVFWALLPFSGQIVHRLPPEAAVTIPKLKQTIPESGVYLWPAPEGTGEESQAAWVRQSQAGPLVAVFYRKAGETPMSGKVFALGLVHYLAVSALAAWLMMSVRQALPTYRCRVFFGLALGGFAGVLIDLSEPLWFHHPWDYHLLQAVYHLGCGLILGCVLGAFLGPATTKLTLPPGTSSRSGASKA